jgi:hypothetical protein
MSALCKGTVSIIITVDLYCALHLSLEWKHFTADTKEVTLRIEALRDHEMDQMTI